VLLFPSAKPRCTLEEYQKKLCSGGASHLKLAQLRNPGAYQKRVVTYIHQYNALCVSLGQRYRHCVLSHSDVLSSMCRFYNVIKCGSFVRIGREMRAFSRSLESLPYSDDYRRQQIVSGRVSPSTVCDARFLY
jgi:hypothetical protein